MAYCLLNELIGVAFDNGELIDVHSFQFKTRKLIGGAQLIYGFEFSADPSDWLSNDILITIGEQVFRTRVVGAWGDEKSHSVEVLIIDN